MLSLQLDVCQAKLQENKDKEFTKEKCKICVNIFNKHTSKMALYCSNFSIIGVESTPNMWPA